MSAVLDTSPEIVSRRAFAATRDQVFGAFRDPAVLARWWGPRGSVNEFHEFDLRPGGRWRFTMRGADGTRYEMDKRFLEVQAPGRIVLRHEQRRHAFTMKIALEEDADGTLMTWRMAFDDAAEAEAVREAVLAANEQNFDRLAEVLREAMA